MDVVPVIVRGDVLGFHVGFVDGGGEVEGNLGAGVVTGPVEDVAWHVGHVAGVGSEIGQDVGGVQGLFGMWAGFDGVNPEVVGG